jgi:hypothetical protein
MGDDVGDRARASRVELVSATLLGVPDRLGLPLLPFSLISLLGDELGEGKGDDLGVPGVRVSELMAELMGDGEEATRVSEEAEVWPVKLEPGTSSLPSLSELSQASVNWPMS